MRVSHYPFQNFLMQDMHRSVCAEQAGILKSSIICASEVGNSGISMVTLSGQMPEYHKILVDPRSEFQYHMGGYGKTFEEAIVKYIGEGVERYSLLLGQHLIKDSFRFATYKELEKEGNVIPFEFLDIHSDEDYQKYGAAFHNRYKRLKQDDVVGWVLCPSLYDTNASFWVPVQMLFTGYSVSRIHNEVRFIAGFSKGAASHITEEQALLNAIQEHIEADGCMVQWYTKTKVPNVEIDSDLIKSQFPALFSDQSPYELLVPDLSEISSLGIHVFGAQLINKEEKFPHILYGAQAGIDPIKCMYRALSEAVAITFLTLYGPVFSPNQYLASPAHSVMADLDSNVALFAHPQHAKEKKELLYSMIQGKKLLSKLEPHYAGNHKQQLIDLLSRLKTISRYAVYLDITPPEAKEKGWHVMRVFIPEMLTMSLPSIPYSNHPRIKKFGGIQNEYPHPLP